MKHFYQLLQSDVDVLWKEFRESETRKRKVGFFWLITLRAFLVVAFAILIVEVVTRLFGSEFVPMGVALLIMILTFHFVPLGYCIQDVLWTLAVIFGILIFVPTLTMYVAGWTLIFIHIIAFAVLLSMTCQNPSFGLGGMVGLIYAYLMRDPVPITSYPQLLGMFALSYLVIALIMIHQHRKKNTEVRYADYLRHFSLHNPANLWLIRMTLGVSIVLAIGMAFHIPRFTWVSFATSTILAQYPFTKDAQGRIWERVEGIAIGCVGFFILAHFVPQANYNLIGLISGFVLGYFYQYRAKTIIICFAPLAIAAPIYGIEGASFLRVMNNVVGAVFATLFALAFDRWLVRRLAPDALETQAAGPPIEESPSA